MRGYDTIALRLKEESQASTSLLVFMRVYFNFQSVIFELSILLHGRCT